MERINMSSSEVLLKIREKLNMTHVELAKELNVTRTAIYNWEKGLRVPKDTQKRSIMNYALSRKIKVKLEDFFNA